MIGTYLHGPLLPKNAWFADWLIATALALDEPLAPLDDELEAAAHAEARRAAGAVASTDASLAVACRRLESTAAALSPAAVVGASSALLLAGCGGAASASTPATTRPRPADDHDDRRPLPGTGKPPVTIGDKNFTEQFCSASSTTRRCQAQGFTVQLNQNIGPTEVTLQALRPAGSTCTPST